MDKAEQNLKEYLKKMKHKITKDLIQEIVSTLLKQLVIFHDHKIMHKDIKLENIF